MDKASKALRRSSVRLKSISSGHRELNLVISELRDVRSKAKALAVSQHTASQDMLKWSLCEENQAIQDTFSQLSELNTLWTEAQREFTDSLKNFIYQFEMILEDENHLDQARNNVSACEMREAKIKKELGKVIKRGTSEEVQQLEMKLTQAEASRDQAQFEVLERTQETEVMKLIRIKEGLLKLSDSYLHLANKCQIVYQAYHDVAVQLPEPQDKDIHELRYAGPALAKQAVLRAKDQVRRCNPHGQNIVAYAPINEGPPPPYSPTNHEVSHPYNPHYVPPSSSADSECQSQPVQCSNPFMSSFQSMPNSSDTSRESSEFSPQRSNPFESDAGATSHRCSCSNIDSSGYSVGQNTDSTDHEDNLAETVCNLAEAVAEMKA